MYETETNASLARREIKAVMSLLLQVDRGLSVETFVLPLHVGETCEVIGVHERQIDLRGELGVNQKYSHPR